MELLSLAQAAERIPNALTGEPGITPARAQQLVRAGRLPATMVGGRWFVYENALQQFIARDRRVGRPWNREEQ